MNMFGVSKAFSNGATNSANDDAQVGEDGKKNDQEMMENQLPTVHLSNFGESPILKSYRFRLHPSFLVPLMAVTILVSVFGCDCCSYS